MKTATFYIFQKYHMEDLGYDFMGYPFFKPDEISYHHFLIPSRRMKKLKNVNKKPVWDGVLLVRNTAHTYLHLIEIVDPLIFDAITSELLDQKIKGHIDPINLININALLNFFEESHLSDRTICNNPLIKDEYTRRLLKRR